MPQDMVLMGQECSKVMFGFGLESVELKTDVEGWIRINLTHKI